MKIKNLKTKKLTKLTDLQLLKSKFYKVYNFDSNNILNKIKNKNINIYIKKISHIIYEYHITNKKILFINLPQKWVNKMYLSIKKTKHIFISNKNLINGLLTNKTVNLDNLILNDLKIKKHLSNLNKKNYLNFDLIVIFNTDKLYHESSLSQIPVITLNNDINKTVTQKSSYKILGDLKFTEKQINNNFFFLIIKSI